MRRSYRKRILIAAVIGLAVAVGMAALVAKLAPGTSEENRPDVISGFLDIDYAQTPEELAQRASVIVYGTTVGQPTITPKGEDGILADYVQNVVVKEVLKGDAPPTISVVRLGLSPTASEEGIVSAEKLGGPLPSGSGVFLLVQSSVPGLYSVGGHTQGTLMLSPEGRVASIEDKGFDSLVGLTLDEIKLRFTPATS